MAAPLPAQLFQHLAAPDPAALRLLRKRPGYPHAQPTGGLWTATYTGAGGSSFVRFIANPQQIAAAAWARGWPDGDSPINLYNNADRVQWWLLQPDPAARVYIVDTYSDCCALWDRYSYALADGSGRALDWERAACDWGALHLTARAAGPLLPGPGWVPWVQDNPPRVRPYLPAWGIESTLWFRWSFTTVTALGAAPRLVHSGPLPSDRTIATWALHTYQGRAALGFAVEDVYRVATVDELTEMICCYRIARDPARFAPGGCLPAARTALDTLHRILTILHRRADPYGLASPCGALGAATSGLDRELSEGV